MDSLFSMLRVAVSLAVVFGLLWYLARRLRAGAGARKTPVVRVLGKAGVGAKAAVVVVEAEGRRMVLGVTDAGVSVLHDKEAPAPEEQPEAQALPAAAAAPATAPARTFGDLLARTQWAAPRRAAAHSAPLTRRRARSLFSR